MRHEMRRREFFAWLASGVAQVPAAASHDRLVLDCRLDDGGGQVGRGYYELWPKGEADAFVVFGDDKVRAVRFLQDALVARQRVTVTFVRGADF